MLECFDLNAGVFMEVYDFTFFSIEASHSMDFNGKRRMERHGLGTFVCNDL